MKRILMLILAVALLGCLQVALAGQPEIGIIINNAFIHPGQSVQEVWGIAGFPDRIRAVRGKALKRDYVKCDYYTHEVTIDINSDTNTVQSILIEKNGVRLFGVPFKVGDPYEYAVKAWGQPEKKEPGYANYFKKGVVVGVGDTGIITLIHLSEPGKIEEEEERPAG